VTLTGRDLVPVLSWLLSQGRCRRCGSKVTGAHALVEAGAGTLFALAYVTLGVGLLLAAFLIALAVLLFVVLYDLRHTVVPLTGSLLLLISASGYALLTHPDARSFGLTLLTAAFVSLFFFLIYAISRGRAMGLGDAPVAFSLALLVGSTHALPGVLFSFWIGALFGIGILLSRRGGPTMGIEVPFVPFLAAGFLLAYFTQWNPIPLGF
jgi:prepilin signal peptidase PulO-like enzyme (type II secretory pathway)